MMSEKINQKKIDTFLVEAKASKKLKIILNPENDDALTEHEALEVFKRAVEQKLSFIYIEIEGFSNENGFSAAKYLAKLLKIQKNLEDLKSFRNQWGDAGLSQLSMGLPSCEQLKTLVLSENRLSHESAGILQEKILPKLKQLESLVLGGNGFNANDLKLILSVFNVDHPLISLSLSKNLLGKEGILALNKWLTPTANHLPPKKLNRLYLNHCGLMDAEFQALMTLLEKHPEIMLTTLFMNNNLLTDASIDSLESFINSRPKLIAINLEQNSFSFDGIHRLGQIGKSLSEDTVERRSLKNKFARFFKDYWEIYATEHEKQGNLLEAVSGWEAILALYPHEESAQYHLDSLNEKVDRKIADAYAMVLQECQLGKKEKAESWGSKPIDEISIKKLSELLTSHVNLLDEIVSIMRLIQAVDNTKVKLTMFETLSVLWESKWIWKDIGVLNEEMFFNALQKIDAIMESETFMLQCANLVIFTISSYDLTLQVDALAKNTKNTREKALYEGLNHKPGHLGKPIKYLGLFMLFIADLVKIFEKEPIEENKIQTSLLLKTIETKMKAYMLVINHPEYYGEKKVENVKQALQAALKIVKKQGDTQEVTPKGIQLELMRMSNQPSHRDSQIEVSPEFLALKADLRNPGRITPHSIMTLFGSENRKKGGLSPSKKISLKNFIQESLKSDYGCKLGINENKGSIQLMMIPHDNTPSAQLSEVESHLFLQKIKVMLLEETNALKLPMDECTLEINSEDKTITLLSTNSMLLQGLYNFLDAQIPAETPVLQEQKGCKL